MARFRRILFNTLTAISLLLAIATAGLWVRTGSTTDAILIPLGGDQALLVKSEKGHYGTITWMEHWADQRFGWWSGSGWADAGPFALWTIHRVRAYGPRAAQVWHQEGQMIVPLASRDGLPAYEQAYDRANALNMAYDPALPPFDVRDWANLNANGIKFGYSILLVVGALPMLMCVLFWLARRRRNRNRVLGNRCVKCGYDMRATPERCPECGHGPALSAAAKRDGLTP